MKKETPKSNNSNPYKINYDNYLADTNASTECTGLIPRLTEDFEAEDWEAYHDVFNFYPGHKDEPEEANNRE